ncbi:hypothetical protein TNCT_308831 [Trichonephila clavata]|uniref:DUF4817 domain-containing protein n=1 Tax=Trichonephila clavata TaxID=2740835 RepID=A0A8X6HX96_TRICU|nr:hypothetical protein TNCT_308831 [Trichonephila clavata]
MVYSLEQRVFFILEFHQLDHSFVALRRSFQRIFKAKNGLTNHVLLLSIWERSTCPRIYDAANMRKYCLQCFL